MKKTLALIPVLALAGLILMGVGTAQAQNSFTAGDLIKLPNVSTVYYYGFDGKRHAFPNEPVYFSWYTNFEGIKVITPSEMAAIALGKNVVVRPGTNLVKLQSDPKVYTVEPYGVLRHIRSESDAVKLYGADWAKRVIDLNIAFFPDYTINGAVSYNPTVYPEGTVYKMLGNNNTVTHLWRNGKNWAFTDAIRPESCRYQTKYTVTIGSGFNFGNTTGNMSYIRPIIIDVAQTLVEETDNNSNNNSIPTDNNSTSDNNCQNNCVNTDNNSENKPENYQDNNSVEYKPEYKPEDYQDDKTTYVIYKIGDRVVYLGNDPYDYARFNEEKAKNTVGTILQSSVSELDDVYRGMRTYLVRFDQPIDSILRAEPGVPYGYCAWIHEINLKLAQ